MDNKNNASKLTLRESFLMSLLNKAIKEYKALLEYTKRSKPLKIVEILNLSDLPGETTFVLQVSHKNSVIRLSAAEIISANYDLNDFSDFHAEMIRQAALGKLAQFLKQSAVEPAYKIISKQFDRKSQQYVFTIESRDNIRFTRTADELHNSKNLFSNISPDDIYDIGYTQGSESILKEKASILLAKKNSE